MSLQYRPVPDEDYDEFSRLLTYAFRPTDEHEPLDEDEDPPASAQLGARRGIYDGDELLCTGRHHWFTLDVRGSKHGVPGLSAVSTPPWNRRRGLVRRLLVESLDEYREREQWFSALWPFEHPFYAKFGWATTSTYAEVSAAPTDLDFVDDIEASGRFVELDADRWEELEAVYREVNDHTLSMYRTEEWWRHRIFEGWQGERYVAGLEREAGDGRTLAGYVAYRFDEDGGDRTLTTVETCAVDFDASVELLRYLRHHDSQVSEVRFYDRPDAVLFDVVGDPRDPTVELKPGPMIRLVDVREALRALDYPENASGTVTLAVADGLAEWNDGTFRLDVANGRATCERVETGGDPGAADASLAVGPLSQLAVGYRSASRLQTVGKLDGSEDVVERLDALFPTEEVVLHEGF
ncbi:GNAT family N-acetyltransferase [Halomarina oriensis]|uniref:GNAT family N-acetyltransferase n=1 Tax=Halomarina oriensis TaxID=671145 RepID=A0A6B0GEI1_9EURY|nr:GNAT family N-acetyltransferase [Halomarina oriensis]MWG33346.1 GNAT family N-acetyltransferase [Halomarina oriensis]